MQKKYKARISLMLVIAMIMTVFSATPSMAASNSADKKPKLPERVTIEKYDKDAKRWVASVTYDFTYNAKGDPSQIQYNWVGYRGESTSTFTYKYRKNGKRESALCNTSGVKWHSMGGEWITYTEKATITYDKKGRRTKEKTKFKGTYDNGQSAGKYSYSDKYKYLKCNYYMTGSEKLKLNTRKKGVLKSIRSNEFDKWRTICTFKRDGLLKNAGLYKYTYTYDKKTGLVKSIKRTNTEDDSDGPLRYVFTYNTRSTSKIRYRAMVNSFLNSGFHSGAYFDLHVFWY